MRINSLIIHSALCVFLLQNCTDKNKNYAEDITVTKSAVVTSGRNSIYSDYMKLRNKLGIDAIEYGYDSIFCRIWCKYQLRAMMQVISLRKNRLGSWEYSYIEFFDNSEIDSMIVHKRTPWTPLDTTIQHQSFINRIKSNYFHRESGLLYEKDIDGLLKSRDGNFFLLEMAFNDRCFITSFSDGENPETGQVTYRYKFFEDILKSLDLKQLSVSPRPN